MTAEKSKDCESAEGSQGVDREGTALAGTNATAVEKGNNEMRQDDATREGSEQERKQQVENGDEDEEQLVIEQPLLTIKEVFVYQVPPLRASSGHRAEEWGLANPVFTGFLKAVQVGNACCLRLFKPPPEGELGAVPELFAECAVRLDNGRTLQVYVESVIDSSRYFVLRCEDQASGRHAYVGIGFRERSSAFDLKAVLDDFVRFLDRQKRAEESSSVERQEADGQEAQGPVKPMKDLSIAEGQKVHLDLKVGLNAGASRARRRPRGDTASRAAGGGGRGLLLAPPPLPGATYKGAAASSSPSSPPPPVCPAAGGAATPTAVSPQTGARTKPPTVTSPASGEPPDEASQAADAGVGDSCDSGGSGGRDGGSGGVGGVDDDDGWGEFESA